MTTKHLSLNLIEKNQSNSHISLNENFEILDVVLSGGCESMNIAEPNGSEDACYYIVPQNASGAWLNMQNKIAITLGNGQWFFLEPRKGMKVFVVDINKNAIFLDDSWIVTNDDTSNNQYSIGDNLLLNNNVLSAQKQTENNYSDTEREKLNSIEIGATKNDSDINLKNRSNHTGLQDINTTTIGILTDSRLSDNVTKKGNLFNNAGQLVCLDESGKLPQLDGSNLINLPNNIDDSSSDISKTYSSNKINSLINNIKLVDDSSINTETSYSSSKIESICSNIKNQIVEIDDSSNAMNKTFSAYKINSIVGGIIDNSTSAESKTYSSSKILELINSLNITSIFIDDTSSFTTKTLSSYKINSLINDLKLQIPKINDASSSNDSLYSSSKIDAVIDNILSQIISIDDSSNTSTKTLSSSKIISLINSIPASNGSSNYVGDYKQSTQIENHGRWFLCNGQAVSRSTYSSLFSLIGVSFGFGDGSTTFNLPDLRGRVFGGIGNGSGLSSRALGQAIGDEIHTLSINEIPSHKHQLYGANSVGTDGVRPIGSLIAGTTSIKASYTGKTTDCSNAMDSNGGGQPHNNMQPTLFAGNYFIYA
jgi:microcystin-dependent protein